jgi:hypothetical protein
MNKQIYDKVKRLAEQSPHEGERVAAKAAMARMEAKAKKPVTPKKGISEEEFLRRLEVIRKGSPIVNFAVQSTESIHINWMKFREGTEKFKFVIIDDVM